MKKWFVTVFVMLLISPVGHLHAVSKAVMQLPLTLGGSRKDLSKLDYVMWRESRCIPRVFNSLDPNGGSAGLMQINQFWCLPNRYYKQGWLQAQGILDSCSELFNPEINLQAGLAIFQYSKEHNNNGWQPWGK